MSIVIHKFLPGILSARKLTKWAAELSAFATFRPIPNLDYIRNGAINYHGVCYTECGAVPRGCVQQGPRPLRLNITIVYQIKRQDAWGVLSLLR